jgi:hypothetical protein
VLSDGEADATFDRRDGVKVVHIQTYEYIGWGKNQQNLHQNILEIALLFIEFTKIIRNEILSIQCTIHNAAIPFYKLTGRFKSEHSTNTRECSLYATLYRVPHINYSRKTTRKNSVLYGPILWKPTTLTLFTRTDGSTADYLSTLYQLKRLFVIELCESMIAFSKI